MLSVNIYPIKFFGHKLLFTVRYLYIVGLFEVAYGIKTILAYPAKQIGKLQLFVS